MQVGDHIVTQKSLYTALFVIGKLRCKIIRRRSAYRCPKGIPMLWLAAPLSTFFWLVGSSSMLIMGHASLMEPGLER
jgi:hypothetical protein